MVRKTSPDLEAQAAAALAAGYPMSAVSEQTGLSVTTLKRIRERTGTVPGSLNAELVKTAKASLVESLGSDYVQEQAAKLVRSQIAITDQIHNAIWTFLDRIDKGGDPGEHVKLARAISGLATAAKLASDAGRQTLALGAQPESAEALPELIVRDYTEAEVEAIRKEVDERFLAVSGGVASTGT